MQQNSRTTDVADEQNAHMAGSSADAPVSDSETNPFSEELDADEITEAYRAQHSPESNDVVSDSSHTKNEPFAEDHSPTEYEYSIEQDLDEHECLLEESGDTIPVSITNKRVLLIEDDDDTTEILKQNLQTLGITKVNVATNAEGALNLLATDKEMFPDVVVLDWPLSAWMAYSFWLNFVRTRARDSKTCRRWSLQCWIAPAFFDGRRVRKSVPFCVNLCLQKG